MKLKDGYIMTELGEDLILVPVGAAADQLHGIIRLNETAAFIVKRLKEETTPAQIVDALLEEYDAARPDLEKHVDAFLEKLRGIGAIEE